MKVLNKTMIPEIKAYAESHTVKETAEYFSVAYDNMQAFMARHGIKHAPRKSSGTDNNNYKAGFAMNKNLYWVYYAMIQRCYMANCKQYFRYGGRGIRVCREWLEDKTSFYKWAIEQGYREGLTLDRIDNDKGYSPENCRWVDYKAQGNNTRRNHLITYKGQIKTMKQWSEELGINYSTLRNRINRSGMTAEEALGGKECQR